MSLTWQKYFSCHVCNDPQRIPFVSLSIEPNGTINGLKRYSIFTALGDNLSKYIDKKENKQSECLKTDFSEFKTDANTNVGNFPSNCALGVLNS